MGKNPILLELSQIDERADVIHAVDNAGADAAFTVDTPGKIFAVDDTTDTP